MFFTMVRKEIVSNVLSARFAVTFVLFFGLVLISVFILTNDYRMAMDRYNASAAAHREDLDEVTKKEQVDEQVSDLLFSKGVYSDRPPKDLSILAKGLEDVTPTQAHTNMFRARRVNEELYRNPIFSLFSTPDFAYIVNIVISLLALLFVFDAICGEKERGTLKLTLANPIPRDTILLSKWIGGYVTLLGPFVVAALSGLIYIRASGAVSLSGDAMGRAILMFAFSLLYISLFFALGMMISTLTHRSSTALLISLFVWICWILVIPNLAPVVAKIASPVPTLQKIEAEKEAVDREIDIRRRRVSRNMLGYGEEAQKLQDELDQEQRRRRDKLDDFYNDKISAQIGISKTISRLSPSASFKYATTELAQTGVTMHDSFKKAYKRFRDEFNSYGEGIQERQREDKLSEDWFQPDEVPQLRMFTPTINDTVNMVFVDILLMAIYNALFFITGYVFFLRYDVR